MWPLRKAWTRWVLFSVNVALAFFSALLVAFVIVFGLGERLTPFQIVAGALMTSVPLVLFCMLAWQQRQRRGRVLQTTVAMVALFGALTSRSVSPAIYGAFALAVVWLLGDFRAPAKPPPPPSTRTIADVAQLMWRACYDTGHIRRELESRGLPADEIEVMLYRLARSGRPGAP